MKRKVKALILFLTALLCPLYALGFPPQQGEKIPELKLEDAQKEQSMKPKVQNFESEKSFPAESSETIEEICSIIDQLKDKWQKDIFDYEEMLSSLKEEKEVLLESRKKLNKSRNFWLRISVYEAALIALGAYCIHQTK